LLKPPSTNISALVRRAEEKDGTSRQAPQTIHAALISKHDTMRYF
jgi:hypothetical protein